MKKRLVTLLFILAIAARMMAQHSVPPCPMPGNSYFDAPLLDCCLNGYSFSTQPFGGFELPPAFCGTVENSQWLAYQAPPRMIGMVLGIEVGNCANFQGLQMQVFEAGFSCGLFDLTPVSNCIETSASDSVTVNFMTPGHVYYIFIDGFHGDLCDYTLRVLREIECPLPQPTLSGPTMVNAGQTATYTVNIPPDNCPYQVNNPCGNIKMDTLHCVSQCVTNQTTYTYIWTGPPGSSVSVSPDGQSANITFGDQSGNVTVQIFGPCYYKQISLYVTVCNIQAPSLQPVYYGECYGPAIINVPGNYTSYDWSNGDSGNPGILFDYGPATVTVTDAQGCTAVANTQVIIPEMPFVQITGPTSTLCPEEPGVLTANAFGGPIPMFFHWSNGMTGNSIIVTQTGNYRVTVTNAFGCTNTDSHQVNFYPTIPMTVLPLISLCQEELPFNFLGTSVTASGTYSAILQSWQGCDSTVQQNITVLPATSPTYLPDINICDSNTAPIDFYGQSISYSAGTRIYQAVLQNSNGCDSIILQPVYVYSVPPISIISSTGNLLPVGGSTVLEVEGFPPGDYEWSTGESSESITVDQPGTYWVVVSVGGGGCFATASITITQATSACPNFNLPIAPADSCATAPSFCGTYLASFCSANDGYTPDVPGNLASVIPCTIEVNQWLTFTACDATVQLEFAVNNCQAATGLEFFILQTDDCQVFTAPQACFTIANGDSDTLTVGNLTVGETYYLMIDGIQGDICNWEVLSTFGVSEGAVFQENNTPGQVESVGDVASFCAGATGSFYFTPAVCGLDLVSGCPASQQVCGTVDTCAAIQYDTVWHVLPFGPVFENGDSIGATVNIIFPDSLPIPVDSFLEYTVSVELVPINVDTAGCCPLMCGTILPDSEPCAILPKVVRVCKPDNHVQYYAICIGECVTVDGQTYCAPGSYTTTTQDECGCTDTKIIDIDLFIDVPPTIGPITHTCSQDGLTYTVSFDVIANSNNIYVDGQFLSGSTFTSGPIPNGQPYAFQVEGLGQCFPPQIEIVSGSHTCQPCIGGTNDLGTVSICPGSCYDLLGNSYCNPGSYNELLYNPATNCNETYIFELTEIMEEPLAVGAVSRFCDATNLYYQVGFPIVDGTPPYMVNGNPFNGSFYQSGLIPSGQPYSFTVTDAATCTPQQVDFNGIYTCNCINNPGTTQLAMLSACDDNMVTVQFNNDAIIGPGDQLVFILHTDNGGSLGQVIGVNTTGTFGFVPGSMTYGQTYRISPAVGPDLGGSVDMNAACFQFAPGQPVVFYEKPVTEILPHLPLNCTYNELTIYTMTSGGSGNFSYEWSSSNPFSSNDPNPLILLPGAYSVVVTDLLAGCTAQAATLVEADFVLPEFSLTTGEINCQQPNAVLEAASQMAGLSYTWTLPTGDHMTGTTITTNIPGDYFVTAQGLNGCTSNETTFVADNGAPPSVEVEDGVINCIHPLATISAVSNDPTATFTWTKLDGSQVVSPTIVVGLPGVYHLVVQSQNGCSTDTSATVTLAPDPVLTAELVAKSPTCFGFEDGSIEILDSNSGIAPYQFSIEGLGTGTSFKDLPAGDYQLHIVDLNGCQTDSLVQLLEPVEVTVNLGDDQFINLGDPVTLNMQSSIAPQSILWAGPNGENWQGVSSLTISPMRTGRYDITIADEKECEATDHVMVYVEGGTDAYLPTAFSPNGDGKNDRFTVFAGADVKQIAHLQIFDRWGELVFEAHNFAPNDDLQLGWDGRHKGRSLDPALFIAMAEVELVDGTKKVLTGEVVLVK